MRFDALQIRNQIVSASIQAIQKFCKAHSESEVCGFALYSDADGGSIGPAFNTRAHLEKVRNLEPDDGDAYKWTPAEWSHEAFGEEFFAAVSDELFALSSECSDEQGSKYRDAIFELCVSALEQLRADYLIGSIYVFSASDFRNVSKEVSWIKRINNPTEASEFESWLRSDHE